MINALAGVSTMKDDLRVTTMEAVADYALRDAGEPCIVVSPCCYRPSDGIAAKYWYFCISTCGPDKQFRTDMVTVDPSWGEGRKAAETARARFLQSLMTRKPLVVHDAGDEVTVARLCESLWPGERITKLRQSVETEYRARGWIA
jgi:hypothetical protein